MEFALVDHLTERSAAASIPIVVDADRLRRKSSAWSSYPQVFSPSLINTYTPIYDALPQRYDLRSRSPDLVSDRTASR